MRFQRFSILKIKNSKIRAQLWISSIRVFPTRFVRPRFAFKISTYYFSDLGQTCGRQTMEKNVKNGAEWNKAKGSSLWRNDGILAVDPIVCCVWAERGERRWRERGREKGEEGRKSTRMCSDALENGKVLLGQERYGGGIRRRTYEECTEGAWTMKCIGSYASFPLPTNVPLKSHEKCL